MCFRRIQTHTRDLFPTQDLIIFELCAKTEGSAYGKSDVRHMETDLIAYTVRVFADFAYVVE